MIIQENIISERKSGKTAKPPGEIIKARLKWFNIPKGFGFVNPEGREDVDAFLHITTLQEAGVHVLGEGACLLCEVVYGDKGAHVKRIEEIISPGAVPASAVPHEPDYGQDVGRIQKMHGTVKWYKPDDGFGFIVPEDGMKDVFIHKTCLDRHDIETLEPGQKIFMTFRIVPKGREVISFKIIEE